PLNNSTANCTVASRWPRRAAFLDHCTALLESGAVPFPFRYHRLMLYCAWRLFCSAALSIQRKASLSLTATPCPFISSRPYISWALEEPKSAAERKSSAALG